MHTAESPTQIFRCTVSSQNTGTCSPPFIPPNIPRPCPSVGPLGTSLGSHLPCTFLYWHPYFPSWLWKHPHPSMLTNIIHIIKMTTLSQINFLKTQYITNKNCKMELADLMFLWCLKYARISNFIKEEERGGHRLNQIKNV